MNKGIQKFLAESLREQNDMHSTENSMLSAMVLNERDVEIIRLISKGLSNKLIAENLNYSEGTVRNRISQILMTTGLTDRTQLALFGIKNRLI
jgi:DNA-binding NarL/FixJ family response regulator